LLSKTIYCHTKMFTVREGQKRALSKRSVYGTTDLGITDEQILLEVETIQCSGRVAKKLMFRAKERGARVVFGTFINHALLIMVANLMGDTRVATVIHYNNLLVVRIAVAVFNLIVHDMNRIVKPGTIGVLESLFGVDFPGLTMTIQRAAYCWGNTYPWMDPLVKQVLGHVRLLGRLGGDCGNWDDATCSMC
jgi:hypothetical protein